MKPEELYNHFEELSDQLNVTILEGKGENNNPEPVNLAKTITTGSEEEIDKPLSFSIRCMGLS